MKKIFIIVLFVPLLNSCFKEDSPVIPGSGKIISISQTIYTTQSFFSLTGSEVVSENTTDAWDLGFESEPSGWHIRINSGKYLGVYSAGTTDFDGLKTVPAGASWIYDKSDGNPDSTAIGAWISPDLSIPTNKVYMLGINDGIKYVPYKKVIFSSVDSDKYSFHFADPDGSNPVTATVLKNSDVNYTCFSFKDGGKTVQIEPGSGAWDLLFTQYSTTLYTSDSIATPYFVRGVLINTSGVKVALDSIKAYDLISLPDTADLVFSGNSDIIGYDWKRVKINDVTASYSVRDNYTYLIKGISGHLYKLRFRSFYNDSGTPGYPGFEFKRLDLP